MPLELRNLGRKVAYCTTGGRHPDDVAGPKLCKMQHPGVGGKTGAAERAEIRLGRRDAGIDQPQRSDATDLGLPGFDNSKDDEWRQ